MTCAFNHLLSTESSCVSAFIGQATDGGTGGIRGRASSHPSSHSRLSVGPFPPTFGVPSVAFEFCNGQSKCQVGNDAVWGNSLLAGDTNVLF